jgi:hypothetical protein
LNLEINGYQFPVTLQDHARTYTFGGPSWSSGKDHEVASPLKDDPGKSPSVSQVQQCSGVHLSSWVMPRAWLF